MAQPLFVLEVCFFSKGRVSIGKTGNGKNRGEKVEVIKGYVEHIVFRNEDNGYTVFHLNNENGELTCVGTFPYVSEGELLEVQGEYITHNVYGTQFQVSSYEVKAPEDLMSLNDIWVQGQSKVWAQLWPEELSGSFGRIPFALSKKSRSVLRK